MAKHTFLQFLREQWGRPVPLVTEDLTGKVVLVTGANTGLGFEAAKHFASMNPENLIIACRNEAKGKQAVKDIKKATNFDNVELFLVDLASYASVDAFCEKVEREVPRSRVQVNHLASAQLATLLLPLLLRTASKGTALRLVFVSSAVHYWSPPLEPPTSDQGILDWLNDKSKSKGKPMETRYTVSNLLNLFFAREFASSLSKDSPLIIDSVNPGLSISALRRNVPLSSAIVFWFWDIFISWPTERGSRQLIFAALGNQDKPGEMKGAYITSSKLAEPSDNVISDEGAKVQKQLWHETLTVLSKVSPKVQSILSSNNLL